MSMARLTVAASFVPSRAAQRSSDSGPDGAGQAGKVSNGTQPRLPPGISELRLRNSRARGIQFGGQAHHGHVVVIMG